MLTGRTPARRNQGSQGSQPSAGKRHGTALLLAGLAVFAVALGGWVIYAVIHPKSFTMDPVDGQVNRVQIGRAHV